MSYTQIIDNLSSMAKTEGENDYIGADGLLVCGKCHTPKQVRVNFLGQEKTPYCICKCEQEKQAAEERARNQVELARRIARNRDIAFPDVDVETTPEDDMRIWTFENDNMKHPELTTAAKKYVENFETFKKQGKGLLFYGTVGTGKSYMAACIANALLNKGYEVLMTNFNRIANTAFDARDKQEYYDSLNRYQLLILDDLGVERNTEYMQEIVYTVIDSRSRINLPLIVTSNLTSQEFKNPVGINNQRIYSRILKMCHPIKVEGEDQRKLKAVQSFAETKKLLGL